MQPVEVLERPAIVDTSGQSSSLRGSERLLRRLAGPAVRRARREGQCHGCRRQLDLTVLDESAAHRAGLNHTVVTHDVFPDVGRTQPFGTGATCAHPALDLQLENRTPHRFRLAVGLLGSGDEPVAENHALLRYQPFLPAAAPPPEAPDERPRG